MSLYLDLENEDLGVLLQRYQGHGIPFTAEIQTLMKEKYISSNFNSIKTNDEDYLACAFCNFTTKDDSAGTVFERKKLVRRCMSHWNKVRKILSFTTLSY